VKVVILGQDPYHGPGQAMGLSFSVPSGVKVPPSLRNIFKELAQDGFPKCDLTNGDLTSWAREGVLLLNALLTVEKQAPMAHAKLGWQTITDALIRYVSTHCQYVVFLLWGKPAQKKKAHISGDHLILQSGMCRCECV
jgi:uracil-DNA glycosylase